MDSRMRRSLDNYITSGRYRKYRAVIACTRCDWKTKALVHEEYGEAWVDDSFDIDEVCPECGAEWRIDKEG